MAFVFLVAEEAALLEAVTERIFPSDETPGARDARLVDFFDSMLGSAASSERTAYREGLRMLEAVAQTRAGRSFLELAGAEQDALLAAIDDGGVAEWPGACDFFAALRLHATQGMFSDPKYGGNAGGIIWRALE